MKRNLSIITVLLVFSLSLAAQNTSKSNLSVESGDMMLPDHSGTFETITVYDKSFTSTLPQNKFSLYENKLSAIAGLFSNHALLTPPTGFGVRLYKHITQWDKMIMPVDFPAEQESKLTASVEIAFSPYFLLRDEALIDFGNSTIFNIYLNNPYNIAGTPLMADIYPCPKKVDTFYGTDVYITDREEVTIFNYSGKPVFLPVSQEEFIQTLIRYWKSKIEADESENQDYLAENENFNSKEALKQRDEEMELAYRELLKYDKQAAEELKKEFEEVKKLAAEYMEETNIGEVMSGSVSFDREQITKLEQELAEMSSYERKRQAFYSLAALENFDNVSGLLPESHKNNGDALVRINPQLVDDNIDKIQLVSIQWHLKNNQHYDSPRLITISSDPGYITDNKILKLYSDKVLWSNLFNTIKN